MITDCNRDLSITFIIHTWRITISPLPTPFTNITLLQQPTCQSACLAFYSNYIIVVNTYVCIDIKSSFLCTIPGSSLRGICKYLLCCKHVNKKWFTLQVYIILYSYLKFEQETYFIWYSYWYGGGAHSGLYISITTQLLALFLTVPNIILYIMILLIWLFHHFRNNKLQIH